MITFQKEYRGKFTAFINKDRFDQKLYEWLLQKAIAMVGIDNFLINEIPQVRRGMTNDLGPSVGDRED